MIPSEDTPFFMRLHPEDDVAVALKNLEPGRELPQLGFACADRIPSGHKMALRRLEKGRKVTKYGEAIGVAAAPIEPGEHVHSHNLEVPDDWVSCLGPPPASLIRAVPVPDAHALPDRFFGYERQGGVGTRNYLGIISTVTCANSVAHRAWMHLNRRVADYPNVDGIVVLSHGGGCAMGRDGAEVLKRTLTGALDNPNFYAVGILGLGCESNCSSGLIPDGRADARKFRLDIQTCGGSAAAVEQMVRWMEAMLAHANAAQRTARPLSDLVVALQCGGSDGYSGITANPALGVAVDLLVAGGGTAILGETPEIYGAEHLLFSRAENQGIVDALQEKIRWWEDYARKNQVRIDNNPTPGNKAGGLTTILEKALGAVTKSGTGTLRAVYGYGEKVRQKGLVFMDTPGYDPVSLTGMLAGGANLACFTTGRGTGYGLKPMPTLKIASNDAVYRRMEGDLDVNAGRILTGEESLPGMGARLFRKMVETASGKKTKSEGLMLGDNEFVPWYLGAVL